MVVSNKRKRFIQKYYNFFISCLCSLLGLIFYLIGSKTTKIKCYIFKNLSFFFIGTIAHSIVNFFFEPFFAFLKFGKEKEDYQKIYKWKQLINKLLVFLCVGVISLANYYSKNPTWANWDEIFFFVLTSEIVNYCLFNLLIQLMNQYGVCSSFSLIFFTENFLFSAQNIKIEPKLILLFVVTVFFIWLTNLKWEVPIETNTLYSINNKLSLTSSNYLSFKLNFGLMSFYYLSYFISLIHVIGEIFQTRKWKGIWYLLGRTFFAEPTLTKNPESFWQHFMCFKEEQGIFAYSNSLNSDKKLQYLSALFVFLFLRLLISWFQVYLNQWNPSEISEDLQQKGIYLDGVSPGRPTQHLLKKVINKLVLIWFFIILIFNIIFDICLASNLKFIGWFNSISIGTNLIQQIRTKYKYVRANEQ